MPMIKDVLKAQLLAVFSKENTPEEAADKISTAIDSYIRTATVTILPGIAVAAPPPSGVGSTTAPGTGTIS